MNEMIILEEVKVGLGTDNNQVILAEITVVVVISSRSGAIASTKRDSRSGAIASTKRDRIRCFKCREYNHFAEDFPTLQVEKALEQTQ